MVKRILRSKVSNVDDRTGRTQILGKQLAHRRDLSLPSTQISQATQDPLVPLLIAQFAQPLLP